MRNLAAIVFGICIGFGVLMWGWVFGWVAIILGAVCAIYNVMKPEFSFLPLALSIAAIPCTYFWLLYFPL